MVLMKRCILISICIGLFICSCFNIINIYRIKSLNDRYMNSIVSETEDNVNPEFYKTRGLCVTAISLLSVTSESEYNNLKGNNSIEPSVSQKYLGNTFEKYIDDYKYPPRTDIYDVLVDSKNLTDGVSFVNVKLVDKQGISHSELYKISIRNNTVVGMHKIGDLK